MFRRNESSLDRLVRALAGAGLLVAAFAGLGAATAAGIVAIVLGAVLLFTAATGFCAIYRLFGLSTGR